MQKKILQGLGVAQAAPGPNAGHKKKKNARKSDFFRKKSKNYLVMPKYWGKQIFSLGRFPRSGSKAKESKKREKKKRPKVGNINGQLRTGENVKITTKRSNILIQLNTIQ